MHLTALQQLSEQYDLPTTPVVLLISFCSLFVAYRLLFGLLKRIFKKSFLVNDIYAKCYYPGLAVMFILAAFLTLPILSGIPAKITAVLEKTFTILLIASATFLLIRVLAVVKAVLIRQYDLRSDDDLHVRKIFTQFQILEQVLIFVLIVFAVAVALMSFDSIRQIGISLLASAGVLGIILGFAAQKSFSTIFAGIQIAIAQPIRLDDVVVVEGEWGRIEEIMLTYVTVRLWDKRRLIVPVNYFLDKTFQNWTRTTSQITGVVYLYADYALPVQPLRDELDRILKHHPLWDGEVKILQVTDSTERSMQLRVLVSAEDSSKVWDLRCDVREKLIDFMQKSYPTFLPKNRWDAGKLSINDPISAKSPDGTHAN